MSLKFPIIFLLTTNLSPDEQDQLEIQIPSLTYDVKEAEVIVGKVTKKQRAQYELRRLGLPTEEFVRTDVVSSPPTKRRKIGRDGHEDDTHSEAVASDGSSTHRAEMQEEQPAPVKVVKLSWFTDSLANGVILPLTEYMVYEGRRVDETPQKATLVPLAPPPKPEPKPEDILTRAMLDAAESGSQGVSARPLHGHGKFPTRRKHDAESRALKRPHMLHQTTSEHDLVDLPPLPEYMKSNYACMRPTPAHPPNEAFAEELKKIRTTRTLLGDQIGVRAYSSAIASVLAYPYTLSSAAEVLRLPKCSEKIAQLFHEFHEAGRVQEARKAEADPHLAVLQLFYDIWGVADATARDFYARGWRDLDDVVEHGWGALSRVQQIGVKYYDEFLDGIPRAEVAAIGAAVLRHAEALRPGFRMVIVGGYRRGKERSGDVDVVISHPDEEATADFVQPLVESLEAARLVTHTLILSTKNTTRGQEPLPWKGGDRRAGAGFDTLDKALVVWQDPVWSAAATGEGDGEVEGEEEEKNPNPHRRVDIIVSPWKTAGCAVLGWSGGTTFQRDLRSYCRHEKSLKFDSSGIRSRTDGAWIDFESDAEGRPAPDMLTAEKRVFAGLGLEWRPPEERWTG